MIGSGNSNPKLRGVQGNRAMKPGTAGPPKTVVGVMPMTFHIVGFHDESGAFQQAAVVKVGDRVFFPTGAIEWASSLKPATEWFAEQFNRKAPADKGEDPGQALPESDPVDIVGGDDANPPAS